MNSKLDVQPGDAFIQICDDESPVVFFIVSVNSVKRKITKFVSCQNEEVRVVKNAHVDFDHFVSDDNDFEPCYKL